MIMRQSADSAQGGYCSNKRKRAEKEHARINNPRQSEFSECKAPFGEGLRVTGRGYNPVNLRLLSFQDPCVRSKSESLQHFDPRISFLPFLVVTPLTPLLFQHLVSF